ncbi:MAG: alpha/beta hydrolase fold protein, partial [Mycobacterium sp.]|nr:alpha/beta hydrolase fold protein [Mycobacterium sp.]
MDLDLTLPSGRIRARSWGEAGAPLLLCVPGLAANLYAFSRIAETLAGVDRRVVALDLRGTGRSEVTGPDTYGLQNHASDVLAIADALGAPRFDVAGWSLGALITMQVALHEGSRLRSVTLIDHGGPTDPAALVPIRDGLGRLETSVSDPQRYLEQVRAGGHIAPWSPFWDNYYTYELEQRSDGQWQPTTSLAAAQEDLRQRWPRDWTPFWEALTMPTTLVRATRPVGGPLVVPQRTVEALTATNPAVTVVSVPGDHFTCLLEAATSAAVAAGM